MKSRLLAVVALLLFVLGPAAAATPDLHDATATFEAFKTSQQSSYQAVDSQYRAALLAAPEDVELAIARCRFVENFSYAEDIDWSDTASAALDSCREQLAKQWATSPSARVFQLEYTDTDLGIALGETIWAESARWSRDLRMRVATRLHDLYAEDDEDAAGRYAVIAARLGEPSMVASGIKYLAGKGERAEAATLARDSRPATASWMATQRVKALTAMGDAAAARRELDRSIGAGLDLSAASQVQAYLADHDLQAARKAAVKLGAEAESANARFDLALANGEVAKARTMVDFDHGFDAWITRYARAVAEAPVAAFTPTLLPFTLAVLLGILATSLLPGLLLVPVHYRGLIRRVRNRAPMPLFERIGLRHAWMAGGFLLVIPLLVLLVMRPDAIGAVFTGGDESASTQFSVVVIGTLMTLLALLPWQGRLRMLPLAGRDALSLRAAGAVFVCWLVVYAVGVLSGLVHHALIGGDSSTLQTRTVEVLIKTSSSQYGIAMTLLFIAGLVPIVEECIFRGMLLGGMSRHISFGWANALQALLFASIHGDPPRFLVYLALGWLAGWLARRYRSLLPAIALHALNNGVATWMHG